MKLSGADMQMQEMAERLELATGLLQAAEADIATLYHLLCTVRYTQTVGEMQKIAYVCNKMEKKHGLTRRNGGW